MKLTRKGESQGDQEEKNFCMSVYIRHTALIEKLPTKNYKFLLAPTFKSEVFSWSTMSENVL